MCHFLIQCPKFNEIRDKFCRELKELSYMNINEEWEDADDNGKCAIILRDFHGWADTFKHARGNVSSRNASFDRKTDIISVLQCDFLSSMWNFRNTYLYGSPSLNAHVSFNGGDGVNSLVDLTSN